MLKKYHPVWLNTHFNHPNEITPESATACAMLADAGIPLGNQSVLLAGINDCVFTMKKLVNELVKIRVRPYYIYQCDLSMGLEHFRTPVSKGIEIIEGLRGHTSGFCVPTFVVDAPGGGGKTPVMPQYIISQTPQEGHPAQLRGRHHHLHRARALHRLPVRLLHRQEEEGAHGCGRPGARPGVVHGARQPGAS